MRSYCTIFDKNYLIQAIALFNSLKHSTKDYCLFCLCMDIESYNLIRKFQYQNLIPIYIDNIIDNNLNDIRNNTTFGQFCWVCQPVFCEYLLKKYSLDMIIYQESDALFFSDPEILINELEGFSSSIVPHNFDKETDNESSAGKYCVQFNAFSNDVYGLRVLEYWKEECFKYSKNNLTYYPGQLCLDNWNLLFEKVKIINNIGAGVAPWNVSKFSINKIKHNFICVDNMPIVFYHFHSFGRYPDGKFELGRYKYDYNVIKFIYSTYYEALKTSESLMKSIDPNFNFKRLYSKRYKFNDLFGKDIFNYLFQNLKDLKRMLNKKYNIYTELQLSKIYNNEK